MGQHLTPKEGHFLLVIQIFALLYLVVVSKDVMNQAIGKYQENCKYQWFVIWGFEMIRPLAVALCTCRILKC